MAVIQISKIQVRRGLQENLPQLAAGELGWSSDERRLWIGNGVLGSPDYAPEIGNTEILTIYSPVGAALSNIAIIESNLAAISANIGSIQANAFNIFSTFGLADATAIPTYVAVTFNTTTNVFDYNITRGTAVRVGTFRVTQINGVPVYSDDYSETTSTGITLSVFATTNASNTAYLQYTSTSTGASANLKVYTLRTFS